MTSRREFLVGATSLAASALGLPATASEAQNPRVEADPPLGSWAYEPIQTLALSGWYTGLPDGSFSGKVTLTRHDFTRTLRILFAQLTYFEGRGVGLVAGQFQKLPAQLRALVAELTPEFTAQKVDPALLPPVLDRFERLWTFPEPLGVTEPVDLPLAALDKDPVWPANDPARAEGTLLARQRWDSGTLCLLVADSVTQKAQTPRALPLLQMPEAQKDSLALQVMQGHNAEMWRLLRLKGAPAGSTLDWTSDLFQLSSTWARSRKRVIALHSNGTHISPDGLFQFFGNSVRLTNGKDIPWSLPGCRSPLRQDVNVHDRWQPDPDALCWGVPGSAVAYLRCRRRKGDRIFAIDLRTGIILNAAAV